MKHPITLITALLLALRATLHAADPFDPATIVGLMRQANDWQTAHPRMKPDDRNWERGTWFTGITAAHKATGDTLAAAIVKCQGADGLWRPNLADPDHIPAKETSGTAFFCYGMAWGIRNGMLDRETYLPVVRKAWAALAASVNAEGMLQRGQQVGDRPAELRQDQTHEYVTGAFLLAGSEMPTLLSPRAKPDPLAESFSSPPDSARPGVYWYFMDGNQYREAMTADLESMHRAGLRKALFLEVNIGVPRGPVDFMSEPWQDNFAHAVRTADRLGMEIILGTGPGWCGAGGPWIDPARSMQHLCVSTARVSGPGPLTGTLPVPEPRKPSDFAGLSPELAEKRQAWHADVTVLAFPTPAETDAPGPSGCAQPCMTPSRIPVWKHVPRFVPPHAAAEPPVAAIIDPAAILDLSQRLRPDGTLDWQVPPGAWTVMRFAARSTGVTTRPAPDPGHGFESDRFDPAAFDFHFEQFHRKTHGQGGSPPRRPRVDGAASR